MRTLIFAALLGASFSAQAASTCDTWYGRALAEGPLPLTTPTLYDSDLGSGRRACPRNELWVGLRAGAVIDVPNFYANIGAGAVVSASLAYSKKVELFGTFEPFRFDWVQNATLKGTMITVGQLTAGASYLWIDTGTLAVSPLVRVMLPTALVAHTRTFGLELGAAASWRLSDRFDVHGYLGLDGSIGLLSGAGPVPRGGLGAEVGAQYNVTDWFGLLLDAKLHAFNRNGPGEAGSKLDYFAPAIGLRFALGYSLGVELSGMLPLLGDARHDGLGMLRVTYRL